MKSDTYLNLCLEQAANSPLHYRHGCVIVKGGKVIGKGFNDYRHGYEGGTLKTGRTISSNSDKKSKMSTSAKQSSFTPFEAMFGASAAGNNAGESLTMHSEMMAIQSALATTSTLAASTVSSIKPSFKLPSDSKRKRRTRSETIAAYVRQAGVDGTGLDYREKSRFEPQRTLESLFTTGTTTKTSSSTPSSTSHVGLAEP